jgi:hypothetical protein
MKLKALGLLAAMAFATVPLAQAQEHMTQGPVWVLDCYQINDGQGNDYLKWLRAHSVPMYEARKKAGLILDYKVFWTDRSGPNDCDITFATLYSSAASAFDYSAADDAKQDEIGKAHWGAMSDEERQKVLDSRLTMRRYIRSSWAREVMLKPLP